MFPFDDVIMHITTDSVYIICECISEMYSTVMIELKISRDNVQLYTGSYCSYHHDYYGLVKLYGVIDLGQYQFLHSTYMAMACHQFSTKPLPELMLTYYQIDHN